MKITIRIETTRKGFQADTIGRLEAIQLLGAFVDDLRKGRPLQFQTKDGVTAAAFEIVADDLPIREYDLGVVDLETKPQPATNLPQTPTLTNKKH